MILTVMNSSVLLLGRDIGWNISALTLGPIDVADVYFRGTSRLEFSTLDRRKSRKHCSMILKQ